MIFHNKDCLFVLSHFYTFYITRRLVKDLCEKPQSSLSFVNSNSIVDITNHDDLIIGGYLYGCYFGLSLRINSGIKFIDSGRLSIGRGYNCQHDQD